MNPEALENIRQLILAGELEEGLEKLEEMAKTASSRYREEVILHLASTRSLQRDARMQLISPEQVIIQRNRITYSVLELVEELK